MEYSIHELARLAGVTTRTLRWYDQTGLLKPCRTAQSGCRYYGEEEVNRLQEILYYRALGVGLKEIKALLEAAPENRLQRLRAHLAALEEEKRKINRLIQSVRDSICAEERKEIMSDEKKFEAFKKQAIEENEKAYGAEARAKYGDDEMNAANAAAMKITQKQYREWTKLGEELQRRLEAAVTAGLSPASGEGQSIAELHKKWLTSSGHTYDVQRHRGIASLYTADARFTAYYDKNISGCAQFLMEAVHCWIK